MNTHSNTNAGQVFFYVDGIPTNGLWIDGEDFEDFEDIKNHLQAGGFILDANEYDGDILVADAEGLAKEFVGRHDTFDAEEYAECRDTDCDDDAKIAYLSLGNGWDEEDFLDAYEGWFENRVEFAEHVIDSTGYLDNVPEEIARYFDYESFGRDLELSGEYTEIDGYWFRTC